jgi:hypothetical protein
VQVLYNNREPFYQSFLVSGKVPVFQCFIGIAYSIYFEYYECGYNGINATPVTDFYIYRKVPTKRTPKLQMAALLLLWIYDHSNTWGAIFGVRFG